MKLILSFACVAWLACPLAFAEPSTPYTPEQITHHWKQVKDYRELLGNPDNLERDPAAGFNTISPPNIQPSLAFLVAAGEMEYVDLVLPDVPQTRETTRHWLNWASDGQTHGIRAGLWEMTGTPNYGELFGATGQPPVHLHLWYDESLTQDIKQLVQELQGLESTTQLMQDIDHMRNPAAKRQVADPMVPDHPRRSELLGRWASEGEVYYSFALNDQGQMVMQAAQGPPWDVVVNHLRWEDDTLRFDEYYYLNDPENPGATHPFDGVSNTRSLLLQDQTDQLVVQADSNDPEAVDEYTLMRVAD